MQHPFEGVLKARQPAAEARPTRRSVLGRVAVAVAALFGVGATASAQATGQWHPTTLAYGEEGGATTLAWGEEGGGATTFAWGEEGGGATTYAWGEQGGGRGPWRQPATTFATWEEGGHRLPSGTPRPPVRRPTTFAYGEEGGRF